MTDHTTRRPTTMLAARILLIATAAFPRLLPAQTPPVAPTVTYDVVSIRLNNSLRNGTDMDDDDSTFKATNIRLKRLLVQAYGIRSSLISGLPGWAETNRYDISAKIVDADPKMLAKLTREQRQAMLVQILTDRFHLRTHIETKTLPLYELVVDKAGPTFKPSATPPAGADDADSGDMSVNNTHLTASRQTMAALADSLSQHTDRTIIDKTGLTGKYDFDLRWTSDAAALSAENGSPDDAPPVLFQALPQQLGLKLFSAKGPVKTLIVDHIEQPTEN